VGWAGNQAIASPLGLWAGFSARGAAASSVGEVFGLFSLFIRARNSESRIDIRIQVRIPTPITAIVVTEPPTSD
jgi:hypothetical protein